MASELLARLFAKKSDENSSASSYSTTSPSPKNEDTHHTSTFDFRSKSIADIGGLNTMYAKKSKLATTRPKPVLYFDDVRIDFTCSSSYKKISPDVLNTFSHYMSSYLVIVKPEISWSDQQREFLRVHKEMLTVTMPSFMSDDGIKREVFVETRQIFAIPREYALALYGPSVWYCFITATPKIVLVNDDDAEDVITNPQVPTLQFEDAKFRATPNYNLKLPGTTIPESCMTRPLKFVGTLRRTPVDQLPIVLAQLQIWRRAFDQQHPTLPSNITSVFCGGGKTAMSLASWAWTCRSDIDDATGQLLCEQKSFISEVTQEKYNCLRTQLTPAPTLKALFVVHQHTLVDQACDAINQYVPDAEIGCIEGFSGKKLPNPKDVDILVVSTDTIAHSFDKFPHGYFDSFPILIMDEAHNNCAEYFSAAFHRFTHAMFKLSLTATPRDPAIELTSGAVLVHVTRPPFPQHTNMIVYGAGERQPRYMPSPKNRPDLAEKPNAANQLVDLYMDMMRNAWLTKIAIDTFVCYGGWNHTHMLGAGESSPSIPNTRLLKFRCLEDAMDLTAVTQTGSFISKYGPSSSRSESVDETSVTTDRRAFDALFSASSSPSSKSTPVVTTISNKPTSFLDYVKRTSSLPASTAHPSRTSTSQPATAKPIRRNSNNLLPRNSELVDHVACPTDPSASKRKPIFFSNSIPHLIINYFWQAQQWMDTCTLVPSEHLRLVRTGVRQIAVIDVRELIKADEESGGLYGSHLTWLCDEKDRYVPRPPKDVGGGTIASRADWESMCSSRTSAIPSAFKPADQNVAEQPGSCRSVRQFFEETWSYPERFDAHFWTNIWFKHYPPNEEWKSRIREPKTFDAAKFSKPQRKKTKFADAKDKSASSSHDPLQQPFLAEMDQSDAMMYYMYFWLPVYGPLQRSILENNKTTKNGNSNGLWRKSVLSEDLRPSHTLPGTLATFGFVVGKSYALPKMLGVGSVIGQAHEKEALSSDMIYAIYQLASTGLDKPELCSSFESTYLLDNVQADGRCARTMAGKQPCYLKNEIVEPWSFYVKGAWNHHKAYRSEKRTINFYRIDKV